MLCSEVDVEELRVGGLLTILWQLSGGSLSHGDIVRILLQLCAREANHDHLHRSVKWLNALVYSLSGVRCL